MFPISPPPACHCPERKVFTALNSWFITSLFSEEAILRKAVDGPDSSDALWGEHSATETMLWTRKHLEANHEYGLHFNEPRGHLLFEVSIASPMKLPQKWSITPVQAMKVRAVSIVLQSLHQLGALSAWQLRRKHVCPLSHFCGDVLSSETERECQETSLLLYLLTRREGSTLPTLVEGHADFPLPSLNWLTWWKFCRPCLSGTKVAGASRPPKNNYPMSPQCLACLGHEPWFSYLTHAKPLQLLPKTSPGDVSSKSRIPSAASTGQASSHASPLQGPTQWLCPSCCHLTQFSFLCERILHNSTIWLELALNARQSLNSLSSCFILQVQHCVLFQVFKSIPSRSTSCDSAGCFLHTTAFIVRGFPPTGIV